MFRGSLIISVKIYVKFGGINGIELSIWRLAVVS